MCACLILFNYPPTRRIVSGINAYFFSHPPLRYGAAGDCFLLKDSYPEKLPYQIFLRNQ